MEHQKSYVFEPPKAVSSRKRKRSDAEDKSWQCRKRVFERLWTRQNARIESILVSANEATLNKVTTFVAQARNGESSQLPAGLITAGPNISSHRVLFDQLCERLKAQGSTAYAVLCASECLNLKSLLKALISKATATVEGKDIDCVTATISVKGPKPLSYDLQPLQDQVESKSLDGVVIVFQDTEAFDSHVISDAIDLLHLWQTRIPFVLLFGVATSTEAFQDRVSRTALRSLRGEEFDVVQADELLEQVFTATVEGDEPRLWLGPEVTSMTFDRQKDHVQNAADFVDALKYAYMSHFFANRVSVWADPLGSEQKEATEADLEAIRMLPSFQDEIKDMVDSIGDDGAGLQQAKRLLESSSDLSSFVTLKVQKGQEALCGLIRAVRAVHVILAGAGKESGPPLSALYARAAAGKLVKSSLLREMILHLKRADSTALQVTLDRLTSLGDEELHFAATTSNDLHELMKSLRVAAPLRSEHDDSHNTVRTTIIAKKAQLSKEKSTLSKNDEAYSKLLAGFVASLEHYLDKSLVNPKDLCCHEIFIYDLKGPHRTTFAPKTRPAIERALSAPHDYLACDCCSKNGGGVLSASLPPTALIYHLYLESGSLINVSDLYSAFAAIVGDEHGDEDRVEALFQRGLADLKYLGIIKPTRKKTDHIAKVAWKGL